MRVLDKRDGKEHFLRWDEELTREIDAVALKYTCEHPDAEIRKFVIRNGVQYCRQCLTCGAKTSGAISKSKVPEDVEIENIDLAKNWEQLRETERSNIIQKQLELQLARQTEFWAKYEAYRQSEKWKNIRKKVLLRSSGICEGCLDKKATQVHHLSYKHIENEFMFELVAICDDCHDRYHAHGRYSEEGGGPDYGEEKLELEGDGGEAPFEDIEF